MESKRRLPIVQTPADSDDPARPGWQWVGFGVVAIFAVWLPLSAAAGAIALRFAPRVAGDDAPGSIRAAVTFAAAAAGALALSAIAGGFVIGKWGGPGVGIRQAALAGLGTAAVAVAASWFSFGFAPGALLVIALAVPFAALGGWLGRRGI